MFDFEKLVVYSKAKRFNKKVHTFLTCITLDRTTTYQLRRASLSIMLNVAEGAGRISKRDKRHFYVIARGSTFECVAIFDFLKEIQMIDQSQFESFYHDLEELSKLLFSLIKSME